MNQLISVKLIPLEKNLRFIQPILQTILKNQDQGKKDLENYHKELIKLY